MRGWKSYEGGIYLSILKKNVSKLYMERSMESVLMKKETLTVKETSLPVSIVSRWEWL